jgi:hypothetical protein
MEAPVLELISRVGACFKFIISIFINAGSFVLKTRHEIILTDKKWA